MNRRIRFLVPLLAAPALFAANLTLQTVDALNRPIQGVRVAVDCESSARKITTLIFDSDKETEWSTAHTTTMFKALIDLTFQSGLDYLVHTATFHKVDGSWILRGVHETLQAISSVRLVAPKK